MQKLNGDGVRESNEVKVQYIEKAPRRLQTPFGNGLVEGAVEGAKVVCDAEVAAL